MRSVRLIHWNAAEAEDLAGRIRGSGIEAEPAPADGPGVIRSIRERPPDAVVISLERLPSHGREVATALRMTKATRHIPIVFAGGDPNKIARVREKIPDAVFASWDGVRAAVRAAKPLAQPVVPKSKSGFDSGVSLFGKLGIEDGTRIALLGAPPEHEERFAAHLAGRERADMTLWFIRSARELDSELDYVLDRSPVLWIFWPKKTSKTPSDLTQFGLRRACDARNRADSKICAVDATWSAMRFTARRG